MWTVYYLPGSLNVVAQAVLIIAKLFSLGHAASTGIFCCAQSRVCVGLCNQHIQTSLIIQHGFLVMMVMWCRACPSSGEATCGPHVPRIHHAVLVGYHHKQIKLAEFPIDLLRMMQSLEWQDHRLESVEGGVDTAQGGGNATSSQSATDKSAGKSSNTSNASASREISLAISDMQSASAAAAAGADEGPSEDVAVHNRKAYALSTSQGTTSTSRASTQNGDKSERSTETLAEQLRSLNVAASSTLRLDSAGPASADTLRLPTRNITSQSSSTSYDNPPRTWLYRTNAPALLSTLHSVAATVPSDASRILLVYLSGDSLRSRMAVKGAGLGMSHPSSAHLLNVAPQGRLPAPPTARLPAVPSTSCLTSSLMAANQAHSHQAAGLRDASGNDLSGAMCLSPPPTAAASGMYASACTHECVHAYTQTNGVEELLIPLLMVILSFAVEHVLHVRHFLATYNRLIYVLQVQIVVAA